MSLIALAFAAALSGQAAGAMPVVAGTTPSPDCGGMREVMSGGAPGMECVTTNMDNATTLVGQYVAEARRLGWSAPDGAANVLWLYKPGEGGKCDRLTIVGLWDYNRYPQPAAGIPLYIGRMVQSGQDCPTSFTIAQ